MKYKLSKMKYTDLMTIGFALLLPGIFLSNIIEGDRFDVIGIIMMLLAAAAFGAAYSAHDRPKK